MHSLRSGEILAITATSYWGPHSGRKDVLYIGAEAATASTDDCPVRCSMLAAVTAGDWPKGGHRTTTAATRS